MKDNHQEKTNDFTALPLLLGMLTGWGLDSNTSKDTLKILKLESRLSMLEDEVNQLKKII